MSKAISFRKGLSTVLFWSVISAAFIGPGTVTTASSAGASFGLDLLWALVFSIIATMVLQEAAARITIASGKSLGEIIAIKYADRNRSLKLFLFLAVAFGCAAYETGNILGAVSGLLFLFIGVPQWILTLALGIVCIIMLWIGSIQIIARTLGIVVAIMGIAFCWVAVQTDISVLDISRALVTPAFPVGSSLLIIGLIGTTIVPYNLFLASGIGQEQDIREMRLGVGMAVFIGGIISVAILLVGTLVVGEYSYPALAEAMASRLGNWAVLFFGFGLAAAGMTSSVTAPLAAAITGRSLFGVNDARWQNKAINFRLVWGSIFLIGLIFSLIGIQPIPAIILAQAINGALLPIVTIFLLLAVNDKNILSPNYTNKIFTNILMLIIVGVTCFLGLNNIWKALARVTPAFASAQELALWVNIAISGIILLWLTRIVFVKK